MNILWLFRMRWALLCLTAALLIGPGCVVRREFVPPTGEASIALKGNAAGATLRIDDLLTFRVGESPGSLRFKVTAGKHRVRVEKGGVVVLDREFTAKEGETVEMVVP